MAIFQIPQQDQRYADSGKRLVKIGAKAVNAALEVLKPSDAKQFEATHQIFIERTVVAVGVIIDFDGAKYRVVKILDPMAHDPNMKGRYMRLICVAVPPPT